MFHQPQPDQSTFCHFTATACSIALRVRGVLMEAAEWKNSVGTLAANDHFDPEVQKREAPAPGTKHLYPVINLLELKAVSSNTTTAAGQTHSYALGCDAAVIGDCWEADINPHLPQNRRPQCLEVDTINVGPRSGHIERRVSARALRHAYVCGYIKEAPLTTAPCRGYADMTTASSCRRDDDNDV